MLHHVLLLTSHKPLPLVYLFIKWTHNIHIFCIVATTIKFSVIQIHQVKFHGIFPTIFISVGRRQCSCSAHENYYGLATVVCLELAGFCRTHIGLVFNIKFSKVVLDCQAFPDILFTCTRLLSHGIIVPFVSSDNDAIDPMMKGKLLMEDLGTR